MGRSSNSNRSKGRCRIGSMGRSGSRSGSGGSNSNRSRGRCRIGSGGRGRGKGYLNYFTFMLCFDIILFI